MEATLKIFGRICDAVTYAHQRGVNAYGTGSLDVSISCEGGDLGTTASAIHGATAGDLNPRHDCDLLLLNVPMGLRFGPDGDLYVGSGRPQLGNNRVVHFDGQTGEFIDQFICPAVDSSIFNDVNGLRFGPDDYLYLTDPSALSVLRYDTQTGAGTVFVEDRDLIVPSGMQSSSVLFLPVCGDGICDFGEHVCNCLVDCPTTAVHVSLCDSDFDAFMAVYEGSACPPPEPFACNDDGCGGGGPPDLVMEAEQDQEYLIRVGGWNGASGRGVIDMSCESRENGSNLANVEENSYHVVRAIDVDASSVFEGLTITRGNAYGVGDDSSGGGLNIHAGNPPVQDCRFHQNIAWVGAAVYGEGGDRVATFVACDITENFGLIPAVVEFDSGSNWINCNFARNEGLAGALEVDIGTVIGCTFRNNRGGIGGAILNLGTGLAEGASPVIAGVWEDSPPSCTQGAGIPLPISLSEGPCG